MNRKLLAALVVIAGGLMLSGCATQSATEDNFGNTVRDVTTNQTYDLGAAAFSNSDAVVGGDPYQLENAVKVHRDNSSKPSSVGSEAGFGSGSSNRQ